MKGNSVKTILFLLAVLVIGCSTLQEDKIQNRHYTIYRMKANRLVNLKVELNAQKYISKSDGVYYSLIVIDKREERIPGGIEALTVYADGIKFYFSNPDKEVASFGANDKLTGSWFRYKLTEQQFKKIVFAQEVKVKISMNYSNIEISLSPENRSNLRAFYTKHK